MGSRHKAGYDEQQVMVSSPASRGRWRGAQRRDGGGVAVCTSRTAPQIKLSPEPPKSPMLPLALTLAALALLAAHTRTAPNRTLLDDLVDKAAALSPRYIILIAVALAMGFGLGLLGIGGAELSLALTFDLSLGMEAAIAIAWAASMVRVKWVAAQAKATLLRLTNRTPRPTAARATNDNAPATLRTETSDAEDEDPALAA